MHNRVMCQFSKDARVLSFVQVFHYFRVIEFGWNGMFLPLDVTRSKFFTLISLFIINSKSWTIPGKFLYQISPLSNTLIFQIILACVLVMCPTYYALSVQMRIFVVLQSKWPIIRSSHIHKVAFFLNCTHVFKFSTCKLQTREGSRSARARRRIKMKTKEERGGRFRKRTKTVKKRRSGKACKNI